MFASFCLLHQILTEATITKSPYYKCFPLLNSISAVNTFRSSAFTPVSGCTLSDILYKYWEPFERQHTFGHSLQLLWGLLGEGFESCQLHIRVAIHFRMVKKVALFEKCVWYIGSRCSIGDVICAVVLRCVFALSSVPAHPPTRFGATIRTCRTIL